MADQDPPAVVAAAVVGPALNRANFFPNVDVQAQAAAVERVAVADLGRHQIAPLEYGANPDARVVSLLGIHGRALAQACAHASTLYLFARTMEVPLTVNEMLAWHTVVQTRNARLYPREANEHAIASAFLEFAIPTETVLRSKEYFLPIPAAFNGPRDRLLFVALTSCRLENGNLRPDIANCWQAAAGGVGPDARPQSMQALDPYLGGPLPNAPGNLTFAAFSNLWVARANEIMANSAQHRLMRSLASALIAVSKRGTISDAKIGSICQSVEEENGWVLDLSADAIKAIWGLIRPVLANVDLNYGMVISNLAETFTMGNFMRLHLTAIQASATGAAAVTMTLTAIRQFPGHPVWTYLATEARDQMIAFHRAHRYLTVHALIGYQGGAGTEVIKSTLFPSVAYAGIKVQETLTGSRTARRHANRFSNPHAANIDDICERFREINRADVNMAALQGPDAFHWNEFDQHIGAAFEALHIL